MTWKDDQTRLEAAFMRDGIAAREVLRLTAAELSVAQRGVGSRLGTALVSDCFQDMVARAYPTEPLTNRIVNLPQLCLFLATFRSFRSSYNVFWQGYYFEAWGTLRSIAESICVLAAFAHGRIPQDDLLADEGAQKRAVHAMVGPKARINKEDRYELGELHDLLCKQVHGSRFVVNAMVLDATNGQRMPSAVPYFDAEEIGHYAQTSARLMWPMLRVWRSLPDRPTDARWEEEYRLLELALRSYVLNDGTPLSKAIGHWVDAELDFSAVPHRPPAEPVRTVKMQRGNG